MELVTGEIKILSSHMKLFIYCVPILLATGSYAQTTYPKPPTLTADEDHHQMMDQLGVKHSFV
jgi:hypothetical protein